MLFLPLSSSCFPFLFQSCAAHSPSHIPPGFRFNTSGYQLDLSTLLIAPPCYSVGELPLPTMDKRHSSPSPGAHAPRPQTHRKRSSSIPVKVALGCSTPEAELILAEGRAAVSRRQASRSRRAHPKIEDITPFRPQDYLHYLNREHGVRDEVEKPDVAEVKTSHQRTSSNVTDRSTSTITGPTASLDTSQPTSAASPLWDYSANIAKFIQTQLNSISSYYPSIYPRSCPGPTTKPKSPPQSPNRSERRSEIPSIIEMPPVRPPLRSAFSAWSSAGETPETDDGASPLADMAKSSLSNFTPSLLRYYENSNGTFLHSSSPLEEKQQQQAHPNASGFSFPNFSLPTRTGSLSTTSEPHSTTSYDDYPLSTVSTQPQLTSSSAPSFSSVSTGSYFDCKRSTSIAPHLKDRMIAALSPHHVGGEIITAMSPFEGGALANVHDIYVESQNRVLVDGLSFDMVQGFNKVDEGMRAVPRVQTHC